MWKVALGVVGNLHISKLGMSIHPPRHTMERLGQLDPRLSVLDTEFDETALEAEAGEAAQQVCPEEVWRGDL